MTKIYTHRVVITKPHLPQLGISDINMLSQAEFLYLFILSLRYIPPANFVQVPKNTWEQGGGGGVVSINEMIINIQLGCINPALSINWQRHEISCELKHIIQRLLQHYKKINILNIFQPCIDKSSLCRYCIIAYKRNVSSLNLQKNVNL